MTSESMHLPVFNQDAMAGYCYDCGIMQTQPQSQSQRLTGDERGRVQIAQNVSLGKDCRGNEKKVCAHRAR
jgi:hypothetical protein